MLFKTETLDQREQRLKQWRKFFAFLPVRVDTASDGRAIHAWLCHVEVRNPDPQTTECRLPGSSRTHRLTYWPEH